MDFQTAFATIRARTLIDGPKLKLLHDCASKSLGVDGVFYECGVYEGGSAEFLGLVVEGHDKTFRLFDTFCGLPEVCAYDNFCKKGMFSACSSAEVNLALRKALGPDADFVIYEGFIPDTFKGLEDDKIAFAHLDVDLYQSYKDCLEFIYPRMTVGGYMVFDDYAAWTCQGATIAVDQFFAAKPEELIIPGTGQAYVVKL